MSDKTEKRLFKESTAMKVFNITTILCGFVLSFVVYDWATTNDLSKIDHPFFNYLVSRYPTKWELEDKILLLSEIAAYSGIMLLISVLATMTCRVLLAKATPHSEADPEIIQAFNCFITNHLEQCLLFFCLLSYWVFNYSNESNKYYTIIFSAMFTIGRFIMFIGFPIHSFINIAYIRFQGFDLAFIPVLVLTKLTWNYFL